MTACDTSAARLTGPAPSFVALIPARLASTRLPNKPLADIDGKPMIVWVAQQARASGARLVAVATDSTEVAAAVRDHGYLAVMTHENHLTGTDRLAQAAAILGLANDEIIVNVQGDEPLLPTTMISDVASALALDCDCAIATAAHPIDTIDEYLSPNVVKVVLDSRQRALYFSRAPIPWARDHLATLLADKSAARDAAATHLPPSLPAALRSQQLPLRHIGLYAYRQRFLAVFPSLAPSSLEKIESLEQLRALHHGYAIKVMVVAGAPPAGVDTPADLARVRKILANARS